MTNPSASLSGHGAALLTGGDVTVGDPVEVTIHLPPIDRTTWDAEATATIRSASRADGEVRRIGLEFTSFSDQTRNAILEFCHVLAPALNQRRATTDDDAAAEEDREEVASDTSR